MPAVRQKCYPLNHFDVASLLNDVLEVGLAFTGKQYEEGFSYLYFLIYLSVSVANFTDRNLCLCLFFIYLLVISQICVQTASQYPDFF